MFLGQSKVVYGNLKVLFQENYQKILGLFVNSRSITFGLPGFLKPVFFIKFCSEYELQNSFKLGSVISALRSPSNKTFS